LLHSVVIEPVNSAARNAECVPRTDVDLSSVDGPSQHSLDAIDRLFVMVIAMCRRGQMLCSRDSDLKCRDAAARILSGNQKVDRERTEMDCLLGRICLEVSSLLNHVRLPRQMTFSMLV